MSGVIAVAAPDAPLVSRVLAGRVLGGARYGPVFLALVAGAVGSSVVALLLAVGVPDAVAAPVLAVALVLLILGSFRVGVGYSALLGRLPRVAGARAGDPYSGALVGALATLRDLGTADADALAVRLFDAPLVVLGVDGATTPRLVLELASGEGPLAAGEEADLLADAVAVAARAPLDEAWCPVTSGFTVVGDLRARRVALSRAAAALRDGVPAEWVLRRLASDPGGDS